jgi:hypothetical protein
VYFVSGSYLLGHYETPAIVRQRLLDQLRRNALHRAGVYQAIEERMTAQQQSSLETVLLAGNIVRASPIKEVMRTAHGGRGELYMEAEIEVDTSGLKRHIDALYDNHALRLTNDQLERQNRSLRRRIDEPERRWVEPSDQPRAAPALARITQQSARLRTDRHREASDLAAWLNNRTLLHTSEWAKAFHRPAPNGAMTYQPAGVTAIPQSATDLEGMRESLLGAMTAWLDNYNEALTTRITSQRSIATGTQYTVEVTGFDGFLDSLLSDTGLPFVHGQLTPEQIQDLDPWSSLAYWVVADELVKQPILLSLEVYTNTDGPGQETLAGAFQQMVLSPVAYSEDGSEAQVLRFNGLEAHLWYLGGVHLPNMGLMAPGKPYVLDSRTNRVGSSLHERRLLEPEVLAYDPDKGRAVFRFVAPEKHPPIASIAATFDRRTGRSLFPPSRWLYRGSYQDLSQFEADRRRKEAFF